MPIQSHTLEQTTQANGSTHSVLRMFDQDGKQYMASFFAPAAADVNAIVTAKITATDAALADAEFGQIVGAE